MAFTLNFNPSSKEVIRMDLASESWRNIINYKSGKQQPCAISNQTGASPFKGKSRKKSAKKEKLFNWLEARLSQGPGY